METAAAWLGWHPNFPYSAIGDWLGPPRRPLVERGELPPMKLFTLLRVDKAGERWAAFVNCAGDDERPASFCGAVELSLVGGRLRRP